MSVRNQALVFLKPHAARHPAARACMEAFFRRDGVSIVHETSRTGPEIAATGAVDRHYAVNARVGTTANPAELYVGPEARERFHTAFGETWSQAMNEGRIVSGLTAQKRLGLDGESFHALWARQPIQKLASGLYVARLPELGNAYVLNGFYPSIREIFTRPDALVVLFVVEFAPEHLPWARFRTGTIGATNPSAADPRSIRGHLHRTQNETGLVVTYRENVIHASASPFEALIEKALWIPEFPLDSDPLYAAGIRPEAASRWRDANPVVPVQGKTAPLVESLEDLDSEVVITRLNEYRTTNLLP